MIAIPNMDKPQSCLDCMRYLNFKCGGDIQDCPLIEIVTCGECKHRDPEDKKCDSGMFERQGCIFPVNDDYFCKYGERRAIANKYD